MQKKILSTQKRAKKLKDAESAQKKRYNELRGGFVEKKMLVLKNVGGRSYL